MKVVHAWILNGPNLNLLGVREPGIYGNQTMDQILEQIRLAYPSDRLDYFQTNHEGELIEKIQEWVPLPSTASDPALPDFVLLNAGGWSHTSVALADAVAMLRIPVFEVHLSHPASRESFRGTSPSRFIAKERSAALVPSPTVLPTRAPDRVASFETPAVTPDRLEFLELFGRH